MVKPSSNLALSQLAMTAAIGSLVLLCGCSSGGYRGPTGTVSGKVTLDGAPVPQGCVVSFVSPAGHVGSAVVDADGKYQLGTKDNPNIPVATYNVAVSPPAQQMSQADYDKYMSGGAAAKTAAPSVIPEKYTATATSGLTKEVKQGPNTINIELTK